MNIKTIQKTLVALFTLAAFSAPAQHDHHQSVTTPSAGVEPQPLLAQALRIKEALNFLGAALPGNEAVQLEALRNKKPDTETVQTIQQLLDPHCLVTVSINPEARVKVARGNVDARLMQEGWATFLVKIVNEAGSTAPLRAESPNALFPMHPGSGDPKVRPNDVITEGESVNRFLEIQMYRNRPMLPNLSGLKLEYAIVQIWCKDAGQREADIGFNIGQGTQDIGFRNTIPILFTVAPSVKVNLHVLDDDGSPTMASFLITDGVERIISDSTGLKDVSAPLALAQLEYNREDLPNHLHGVYPLPSRRVAATDAYPDFYFQPQIYRADGEHVMLPPGTYNVTYTRGPEYVAQTTQLIVPTGVSSYDATFKLKRWIDLESLGYHSADHHVHGAGCSHYDSPEEGVPPGDMWRQALGEDLNVSAVLAWGPSWYHQKTFFTGKDDPLSTKKNIMRADVEVSGFPSSHAGHIVLLNLKEDDLSQHDEDRGMAKLDITGIAVGAVTRRCGRLRSFRLGTSACEADNSVAILRDAHYGWHRCE